MSYFVEFDEKTGIFSARNSTQPLASGEGASLYAAIDNLEADIKTRGAPPVRLVEISRGKERQVELTMESSQVV